MVFGSIEYMKSVVLLALASLAAAASAEITYRVQVLPDRGTLHVTMTVPHTERGAKLQLPNWGPGGYVIRNGAANLKNLVAHDTGGGTLSISTDVAPVLKRYQDGAEWKEATNPITTYTVAPSSSTVVEYDISNPPVAGAVHWGGPQTYLYEVNRKKEKCRLEIQAPAYWMAFTGLDAIDLGHPPILNDRISAPGFFFTAPDYDTLADNPVSIGTIGEGLLVDKYMTLGRPHYIVMRGEAKSKIDRAKLLQACKFVSDSENDFFGNKPPYHQYVWHFAVNGAADGAGGLEHLSSTQITLAAGLGPRAQSVLAHEFFHLWNVKRIRSFPLGPFDYTRLPETGALWWLEGVTDYYGFTIPHRYGWIDDASYFKTAASNLQLVQRNPAFKEVSANEASMRVGEANSGRGNSNGYKISYYNLGWLAGMCLDLDLRARTGGKRSLDDIEHALWDLCKDGKPGFQEGEIRRQYVRFGGDGAMYDRIVMQPAMPVEDCLAKAGLRAVVTQEPYVDWGFGWGGFPGATSLPVNNIHGVAIGKLQEGDVLVAVNGKALEGDNARTLGASMTAASSAFAAGTPFTVTVLRGGSKTDVTITPVGATRPLYTIERDPAASPAARAVADGWLAQKALKP